MPQYLQTILNGIKKKMLSSNFHTGDGGAFLITDRSHKILLYENW